MPTLIVDSGSTKTHWLWSKGTGFNELLTQGLNPRFTSDEVFFEALDAVRKAIGEEQVLQTHFYGAGCGTKSMQERVKQLLLKAFPQSHIEVAGDLLGACRACCGAEKGLVGILGTGSNMCYFDGEVIARQRFSTGYILGDEGSGNHIGRRLLKDYLEERMPKNVSVMFHDTYTMTSEEFIDNLYGKPTPNRYLASFAPFAAKHRQEGYISEVLKDCFSAFLAQLDYFPDQRRLPLHLVGGLAMTFEKEIREAAEGTETIIGTILPDPAQRLLAYHLSEAE